MVPTPPIWRTQTSNGDRTRPDVHVRGSPNGMDTRVCRSVDGASQRFRGSINVVVGRISRRATALSTPTSREIVVPPDHPIALPWCIVISATTAELATVRANELNASARTETGQLDNV